MRIYSLIIASMLAMGHGRMSSAIPNDRIVASRTPKIAFNVLPPTPRQITDQKRSRERSRERNYDRFPLKGIARRRLCNRRQIRALQESIRVEHGRLQFPVLAG